MSSILIIVLLLVVVLVAASLVLSRTTYQVQSVQETEYVELEGNFVRYRVAGGGPAVVLVHGWLSSEEIWEHLAERLAQRFTVYTLDLPGFGESDKPASGYGVRYGSRLLYAFCAHFGLTRAAIVGHDVGGAMAVKLAADHPDVVGRMVLVATPANEDQIDLPTLLWLATLPVVGPVFYALGRYLRPLRRLWMRPFVMDPEDLTEEVVNDVGKSTPAAVTKTLNVTRREIARGRLARQASVIKAPVLAIAGEEDQIVDPQATEDWSRTFSAEIVLLGECGHLPMLERTGEFSARVLAFLTGDQRYFDASDEWLEDRVEKVDEDASAEASDETPFPARDEPDTSEPEVAPSDDRPNVIRKQDGRYPPRSPEPEDTGDQRDVSPDPNAERHSGPIADNGAEGHTRRRPPRTGGESGPLPEIPDNLFEWPDSLKEARPWDRSRETERPGREERVEGAQRGEDANPDEDTNREEDTDPNGPKEGPRS